MASHESAMPPPPADNGQRQRSWVEFAIFAVVAAAYMFMMGIIITGVSFENRDLIDTDGYMRYLRVDQLLNGGEWFDPMNMRSNYPFGETQHWTRIVDIYVIALTFLLKPFFGSDALYTAGVINGPLLFLALGGAAYWAFYRYVPRSVRAFTMPALLAFWPIVVYAFPGRLDHHAPIMVAFVVTLGWVLRLLQEPSRRAGLLLGLSLALGMWTSVEFLVATGLTALVVGLQSAHRPAVDTARHGATAFLTMAAAQAVFVLVERGGAWSTIELDRLSTVHVALSLAIGVALFVYARTGLNLRAATRWLLLGGLALVCVGAVVLWHPGLAKGPFGEVDPVVQEIWLFHVRELRPLFDGGFDPGRLIYLIPVLGGLVAGAFQLRKGIPGSGVLLIWLTAYTILMFTQIRWASFAQLVALPFLLTALATPYERMSTMRTAMLILPLALALIIVGLPLVGPLLAGEGDPNRRNCRVSDAVELLIEEPATTVLAIQDAGPETMYRTAHNVIATPYHRNEEGILFVRDAMSMTDFEQARESLASRDVGLILICEGRNDLTRPTEPDGTLYQALVEGRLPAWASAVPVDGETDWLLFRVSD